MKTQQHSLFHAARAGRTALCAALLLASLASCRPLDLYYVQPAGPPEYQLGWQDGCDTGLSAQGGFMYKFLYGFKKRPEMGNNEMYKQAWNEGFTYCRFSHASIPAKRNLWR